MSPVWCYLRAVRVSLKRRISRVIRPGLSAVGGLRLNRPGLRPVLSEAPGGHSPGSRGCRLRCRHCSRRFPRRPIGHLWTTPGHVHLRTSDRVSQFGRPQLRQPPQCNSGALPMSSGHPCQIRRSRSRSRHYRPFPHSWLSLQPPTVHSLLSDYACRVMTVCFYVSSICFQS